VNLSWTDNSGDEDGFKIERCMNAACSNFTEIAQVNANVTTFSDTTVVGNAFYRYQVRAFNAGGNSTYSNIAEADTTISTAVFRDDFNDGTRDTAKWNVGILSRTASNFDPLMPVTEQAGTLNISPRANQTGSFYSGYVTAAVWDLTSSSVSVEVVQKAAGNSATIFSAGIDKDNWYSLRGKANTLYLESRRLGVTTSVSIAYNATTMRFWRLRHDAGTDSIVFETSPDRIVWTQRQSVARQIAITAVRIELIAGTGEAIAAPGSALFDNLELGPNP